MSFEHVDPKIRKLIYFGGITLVFAVIVRPGWIWYPLILFGLYLLYSKTDVYYLLNETPLNISELKVALNSIDIPTKN